MLSHCLRLRKKTKSKEPRLTMTIQGNSILLSKYTACDSTKHRFIKEQAACELLSNIPAGTGQSCLSVLSALQCSVYVGII